MQNRSYPRETGLINAEPPAKTGRGTNHQQMRYWPDLSCKMGLIGSLQAARFIKSAAIFAAVQPRFGYWQPKRL